MGTKNKAEAGSQPYHLWANREAGPMVVWLNVVC
ncbi:MAG: hypothetical protein ACPLTP_02540 [Thermotoga caldifontis]